METEMELLEHELKDMYFAEKKLVKALGKLAKESSSKDMKRLFADHRLETEGHVQRIEESFKILGIKPAAKMCHGIIGLLKEKDSISKEKPSPEILDMFNKGAAMKTERYEITAYESILKLLEDVDQQEVHTLLAKTLAEERTALNNLQALA